MGDQGHKKGRLEERLKMYPYLRSRFEGVMDIVEDTEGDLDKADDAEQRLIDEMRELGKEALHDWAVGKEVEKVEGLIEDKDGVKGQGKKKLPGIRPSGR